MHIRYFFCYKNIAHTKIIFKVENHELKYLIDILVIC